MFLNFLWIFIFKRIKRKRRERLTSWICGCRWLHCLCSNIQHTIFTKHTITRNTKDNALPHFIFKRTLAAITFTFLLPQHIYWTELIFADKPSLYRSNDIWWREFLLIAGNFKCDILLSSIICTHSHTHCGLSLWFIL